MNNIIASDIYETIKSKENIDSYLNDILEISDLTKERKFNIFKSEEIWDYQIDESSFAEWLYSKENPELVDLKKELSILINKAKTIDRKTYNKYESYLEEGSSNFYSFSCQFVFFSNDDKEQYHNVSTLNKYYKVLRWYLRKSPNINTLFNSGKNVFPNLYFHENVLPSLRTLNNSFSSIVEEIIEHLEALELYSGIENKIPSVSNRVKCQQIVEKYNIDCSPETSRERAKIMSFEILVSERKQKINCEYHTKFKKFGRDNTKQDRIYFSFGDKEYEDGKMIIYHIGDHV